jgi:hypothetical protein
MERLNGLAELASEKENGQRKNPYLLEQITVPALAASRRGIWQQVQMINSL